jgi:sugar phosphate isomerase/epimerase
MKIGCQTGLLPGKSIKEKFEHAKKIGIEGIEVWGAELLTNPSLIDEYNKISESTGVKISTICAGYKNFLLEPLPSERESARKEVKKLLETGKKLNVVGLILVPIFGGPKISDLTPYKTSVELEKDLLSSQLPELAEYAENNKCCLLLEPLNRYETHFLNRLEQAVEYCEKINNPYLKIMADLFHMSIEEVNIGKAIEKAGKWVSHVHLADSNRILPGMGHTDFKEGFSALKKIGFSNYMVFECGVPEPQEENLKKSVAYLKDILSKI